MSTQIVTAEVTSLSQTKSPAIPFAPQDYNRQYLDDTNKVLRQYFITLDNFIGQFKVSYTGTVADLPSASVAGIGGRAFVTDSSVSTFGTTVAGGGSTKVPVYSDGTNWKVG
jgi:hypothetical protein